MSPCVQPDFWCIQGLFPSQLFGICLHNVYDLNCPWWVFSLWRAKEWIHPLIWSNQRFLTYFLLKQLCHSRTQKVVRLLWRQKLEAAGKELRKNIVCEDMACFHRVPLHQSLRQVVSMQASYVVNLRKQHRKAGWWNLEAKIVCCAAVTTMGNWGSILVGQLWETVNEVKLTL